jgi:hypothetical protein
MRWDIAYILLLWNLGWDPTSNLFVGWLLNIWRYDDVSLFHMDYDRWFVVNNNNRLFRDDRDSLLNWRSYDNWRRYDNCNCFLRH